MEQLKKILLSLIASLTMLLSGHSATATPPNTPSAATTNVTSTSDQSVTPTYIPIQIQGGEPTESGCPQEGHIKSPSSFNKATVTFDNQAAADLKVYWIDFSGKRKFYSNLKAHSKYDQATWIGHVWVVADPTSGQCLKLESANAVSQELVIN